MSLQLTVDAPYGDATYWKAFVASIDTRNNVAIIEMRGYASQAAKDAGKSHYLIRQHNLTATQIPFTNHNITLADVYAYLKTLEEYSGAVDI